MCRKNDKLTFQSGVPSSATEDIKSKIVFLFGISHNSTCSQFFFEESYFFIKKIQSEISMLVFVGWGTFFLERGGRPENYPFSKTCLVTKRVAVGAFGAFPLRIAVIFHADADFEVKSGVDSYF